MSHNTEEDMTKKKVFIGSAKNIKGIVIDTFVGVLVLFVVVSFVAVVFVSRATKTRVSSNLPQLLHPRELAQNVFTQFFSQVTRPKPGNCLVVEEQYCNGKAIPSKDGKYPIVAVVFNAPAGAPVFMPFDGYILPASVGKNKHEGVTIYVSPDGTLQKATDVFTMYPVANIISVGKVIKGAKIAEATSTQVDKMPAGYTLGAVVPTGELSRANILLEPLLTQ